MRYRNYEHEVFLIVIALIAAIVTSMGCSSKEKSESQPGTTMEKTTTYGKAVEKAEELTAALSNPEKGIDPVCGMVLDENMVVIELDGKKYGFCSAHCAELFKADPAKYLASAPEGE